MHRWTVLSRHSIIYSFQIQHLTYKDLILFIHLFTYLYTYGLLNDAEGARDFSLFQDIQTDSGTHPASYSIGTGVFSWR
jgi:hypothetical protein